MNQKIKTFGLIAILEGVSYVILLAIAMPLKYMYNLPQAVKVTGWAHGVLFVLYGFYLMVCWLEYRWSLKRVFLYFVASLLPIVPFFIERKLRKEYQA